MNTSSIPFHLFLLVLITLTLTPFTKSQTIPQSELNSYIWLVRQYGASLPQSSAACNGSYYGIVCIKTNNNTEYHFSSITIYTPTYSNVGAPDPMLTEFTFPELHSIIIYSTNTVANTNINTLSRLSNIPNLSSIIVYGDPSLKSLPPSFPSTLPLLTLIQFQNNTNFNNMAEFFTSASLDTIIVKGSQFNQFAISNTISLPKLKRLTLNIDILSNVTINTSITSFPSLMSYDLDIGGSGNLILNVGTNVYPTSFHLTRRDANSNITFQYPQSIYLLYIIGQNNYFKPYSLTPYINASTFYFYDSSLTSFPTPTTYPPKMTSFIVYNSLFTSIPNSMLPSTTASFMMPKNQLEGILPTNIFANTPNGMQLDISDNPLLQGTIPESFCRFEVININNTAISSIPVCMSCFYKDLNGLPTNLIPNPPICNITLDQNFVPTVEGQLTITGNNLGWGKAAGALLLIPNKKIVFTIYSGFQIQPAPYQVNLSLSDLMQVTVNVSTIEVGIGILSVASVKLIDRVTMFDINAVPYNYNLNHTVLINGTYPCVVISQNTFLIRCKVSQALPIMTNVPIVNITLSNQYYSKSSLAPISYIKVTAIEFNNSTQLLDLYGYFGSSEAIQKSNELHLTSIVVNNTNICVIQFINSTRISCILTNPPSNGIAPLEVTVYPSGFYTSTMLNFGGPSKTYTQDECEANTKSCYGNGNCDTNGICQCGFGFNPNDNCYSQFVNGTSYEPNYNKPIVKLNYQGETFEFTIAAIEELNINDKIINQLGFDSNWITNITKGTNLTTASYQLQIPSTSINSVANITIDISFSSLQRDVEFGNKMIHVLPSSLKVAMNITNWQFQTGLSYLRVVFSTVVDNSQAIVYQCQKQSIQALSYDDLGISLQSLRVLKGNVQFSGRFIDYLLSDGRPTFSRTVLINETRLNDDQSTAYIGALVPQCSSCILDPDFTPLLVSNNNKDKDGNDCPTEGSSINDKKWKIAVGVSVGGAVLLTAVAIIIFAVVKNSSLRLKWQGAKSVMMKKMNR